MPVSEVGQTTLRCCWQTDCDSIPATGVSKATRWGTISSVILPISSSNERSHEPLELAAIRYGC
jgi:hypothetical protein